jgi:hypothetical protein
MESEKVKEIKMWLFERCNCKLLDTSYHWVGVTLGDILTLINELESENEAFKSIGLNEEITVGEYLREMQRLKDRVAELEKENKEQLKQFAERLIEKLKEKVNADNVDVFVECAKLSDETLKEFTNE